MVKNKILGISMFVIFLILMLPVCFADEINLVTDANGNVIDDGMFTREYNSLNQLTKIINQTSSNTVEEFVHHPIEERVLVKKVYDDGILKEKVIYVNENSVRVVNDSGSFDFTYVYHNGQLVAQELDGERYFVHSDHLGSSTVVTDDNGDVVENTTYSPFGSILEGGEQSRYDYTGQEYDSALGDYDYNARRYDSDRAQFNSPDPIKQDVYDPQLLNSYSYVRNNPYIFIDPDGKAVYYVGVSGVVGFLTGVEGSAGLAISISLSGFDFGAYTKKSSGVYTPTLGFNFEFGEAPFQKTLDDFEGKAVEGGGDLGELLSVGLGISVPFEDDEDDEKDYEWSKFAKEVTVSVFDLNPPILPASGYGSTSETSVYYIYSSRSSKSSSRNSRIHVSRSSWTSNRENSVRTIASVITRSLKNRGWEGGS